MLRAANGLVAAKLIEDWARGGALAAIYYEPFATYDADIFFIPADKGLTAGIPAIYAAREPFAEKIRKVGQLIRLAKTFPRRNTKPQPAAK